MLTLEKPFRVPSHVTAPALAPFLAAAEPRVERLHDGDFPEELAAVIMKAMARDPACRYESAGDLALSLDQFAASRESVSRQSTVARPHRSSVDGRMLFRGTTLPFRELQSARIRVFEVPRSLPERSENPSGLADSDRPGFTGLAAQRRRAGRE